MENTQTQISFDLWMTLVRSHPEYKDERARVISDTLKELYGGYVLAGRVKENLRTLENMADHLMETTTLQVPRKIVIANLLHRLRPRLPFTNTEVNVILGNIDTILEKYPPVPIEGAVELLDRLSDKAKYRLCLISNTVMIEGFHINRVLGSTLLKPFDQTVYSDIHNVAKPSELLFNIPFETNHFQRGNSTWHVGDNQATDGGCVNSGYKFLHLDQVRSLTSLIDFNF
jgi:putative hydrolase of the HAD superfamily